MTNFPKINYFILKMICKPIIWFFKYVFLSLESSVKSDSIFLPISTTVTLFACCWKKLFSLLFTFNKLLLQKKSSILFQKILIACHKLLVKTVLLSWCKCNPLSPKCFLLMLLLSIVWICNSLINLFVFRMVGFAFVLSVCTINLFMITQDFGSDPSIFFLMWSIYLWSFVEYQLLHCWYQHGS